MIRFAVLKPYLVILCLAFAQNASFSIVSRARNRNSQRYHLVAACFSNTIWFFTLRALVLANMTWALFLPYVVGTVSGSMVGSNVSMWFERLFKAKSDDHLETRPT